MQATGKPSILIVDEDKALNDLYVEIINDQTFDVRVTSKADEAIRMIATNPPEAAVIDVVKVDNIKKVIDLIDKYDIMLIWASKFEGLDLQDLPRMARILNKPFRPVDLRFALRAEFARNGRQI